MRFRTGLIALIAFLLPSAAFATLVDGSQINRTWGLVSGKGLKILGAGSSLELSGSVVVRSGPGLTTLYVDAANRKVGIKTTTPKAPLDVLGTASASSLTVSGLKGCDTIDTDNNGNLVCGTDSSGGGGGSFGSGNLFTLSNARYVKKQGDTMTGALLVKASVSGASLRVSNLKNCDTIDTDVNGNLVCGTDNDTDTNTTYTAGQGLTLVETSFKISDSFSGTTLKIYGTASGDVLHAQRRLESSGSLAVQGAVTFKSLTSCQALQSSSNGGLSCAGGLMATSTGALQTAFDARYVNVTGDTMTDKLIIGVSSGNLGLDVKQIASGAQLYASTSLTSSGLLVVKGGVTFKGLPSCTALSTSSAGALACQNAVYMQSSTGSILAMFKNIFMATSTGSLKTFFLAINDTRYVNTSGDTMTGTLVTRKINASGALTITARVGVNTGSILIVDAKGLVYDGTNKRVGVNTASPETDLEVAGSMSGNGLVVSNLKNCDTIDTNINGVLVCGSDNAGGGAFDQTSTDKRYVQRQGDTMTGSLLVKSSISGASLRVSNLKLCDTIDTDINGNLTCGTDASGGGGGTFGSGNVFSLTNSRYVKKQGDTMTGGLLIVNGGAGTTVIENGLLFEVGGTMSGRILKVMDSLNSSGTLVVRKNAVFDTNTLFVDATNNRVGIVNAAPKTALEVIGTLSGSALTVSGLPSCNFLQTSSNGSLACITSPQQEIMLSAGGGTPQTNSGSVAKNVYFATSQTNYQTQAFPSSGSTIKTYAADFMGQAPTSYTGNPITVKFMWFSPLVSGNIKWFVQCKSLADNSSVDTAWGSSGSVIDTPSTTANNMNISAYTGNVTCGGTVAGAQPLLFRVFRSHSIDKADTLSGTGNLAGAQVRFPVSGLTQ